jgi:ribosomal protein S18 acetylase RimI-like enzyme
MSPESFEEFKLKSQTGYAHDLARVEEISLDMALKNAAEQFNKLVSGGTATPDHLFFDVVDQQSNQTIGFLWLGFQIRFGRKIASINDISIHESSRGKGFGKNLMKRVEEEALKAGAASVRLHVFYSNEVAKSLYLSMGFKPTNLDMRKNL